MPLPEAAPLLGLAYDTARKRLNAGTLRGEKHGGRWLVWVPTPEAVAAIMRNMLSDFWPVWSTAESTRRKSPTTVSAPLVWKVISRLAAETAKKMPLSNAWPVRASAVLRGIGEVWVLRYGCYCSKPVWSRAAGQRRDTSEEGIVRRRGVVLLVGVVVIALALVSNPRSSNVDAQDASDDRLAALETRVAGHSREIERLENRLATVEAAAKPQEHPTEAPVVQAGRDPVNFSGSGATAIEPFPLEAGLYTMTATCDGGVFSLDIDQVGGDEIVLSPLIGMAPYEGSANIDVEGGRYAFSVTCSGSWTLTIEEVR